MTHRVLHTRLPGVCSGGRPESPPESLNVVHRNPNPHIPGPRLSRRRRPIYIYIYIYIYTSIYICISIYLS